MKKYYFLIVGFLFCGMINAQIVNIPDANFKAKLLMANSSNCIARNLADVCFKIDANNDGEIQQSEALAVRFLDINYSSISNLTGISYFSNLVFLLSINNQLINIDISGNVALIYFDCRFNQLTNLDVNNNLALYYLDCGNNQLTSLDVSNNSGLTDLFCNSNQLSSLFIKNGSYETQLYFGANPNLLFICTDDNQIIDVKNEALAWGYTNCQVNSYCSFTPGGTFYTIQGNSKFDGNNNGCDDLDNSLKLKYNITNGTISGSIISNEAGNYFIPVQAGAYTVAPFLENPTYFSVSPPTLTVDFPATTSPSVGDFCINANGVHNDLEVVLLSIIDARPGFNAEYKVIVKNKGTQAQSGTVSLTFDDAVIDFVSANPATTSQTTNNFNWSFTNLLPFETREILVVLNVNSPTETPSVNGGDILNYTANIIAATDETPLDNVATLNQTVVNSFDPNDKTCLEGATITPSQVGKEVHYMIRFENTGTANAENIVVKDMIDTAKFDINSLIPISGSHPFVTRITNTNKVEFIFENINLPFDDANNDGYVAFKIKTKPTLVLGDTFSNTASIYFDYNFPIVTNTATTTVSNVLANQDFEFDNFISINPNPAKESITINTKDIEVSSISIYNTLGQLVQVIPNAKEIKKIDVSELKSGNYFIKVVSDKGASSSKFIKE